MSMIYFLSVRCPSNLDQKLRIIKNFFFCVDMTINTDETEVMIIKSKEITYTNFVYNNNNLEEVTSYKYLKIDLHDILH